MLPPPPPGATAAVSVTFETSAAAEAEGELHDELTVETAERGGTRFEVWLPVDPECERD